MGILPFTVELLKRGSKVLCCSNSKPALNDVTNKECEKAFKLAAKSCVELDKAINNNRLLFYESGSEGPCLDLRNLNIGKNMFYLLTIIWEYFSFSKKTHDFFVCVKCSKVLLALSCYIN